MSLIFVPVISVSSVLTLTWLKALGGGAEDLFDCTVERSSSRLHPPSVIRQTCRVICVAYISANRGNKRSFNIMQSSISVLIEV